MLCVLRCRDNTQVRRRSTERQATTATITGKKKYRIRKKLYRDRARMYFVLLCLEYLNLVLNTSLDICRTSFSSPVIYYQLFLLATVRKRKDSITHKKCHSQRALISAVGNCRRAGNDVCCGCLTPKNSGYFTQNSESLTNIN